MKSSVLFALALLPAAALAGADEKPAAKSSSSSGSAISVETSSDGKGTTGKAIITTTDSDGKQQTQVIDLKDGEHHLYGVPGGGAGGKIKMLRDARGYSVIGGGGLSSGPVTWFGVASDPVSEEIAAQLPLDRGVGLIVRHLVPESPAQRSGLAVNDVLHKFDDQLLVNPDQLRTLVRTKKAGDTVKLTYFRKGQQSEAQVKLEQKDIPESDEGVVPPIINLESGKLKVDQLLKGLDKVPAPLAIQKKIVVTSPEGKILSVTEEGATAGAGAGSSPTPADAIKKAIHMLQKSGANEEAIKALEKALQETSRGKKEDAAAPKEKKGDEAPPKVSN